MLDVLRLFNPDLIRALPRGSNLLSVAQRALAGEPAAREYLRQHGIAELCELVDVARPGVGRAAQEIVQLVRDTAGASVVDGEYRLVDEGPGRAPWMGFLDRLVAATYGAHVVLGPVGSGKTTLALRLAQRWREKHGYVVECVNMYGEDRPAWAVTIDMDTLTGRMRRLARYLRSQTVQDEDEPDDEPEEPVSLPPQRRVVVVDEAILSMSTRATDAGRNAALQALAQCRHLGWHVVYCAQWAGQLPPALFGQTTVWVKRPIGREAQTDRDNPIVRDLWERAEGAFAELRHSPWYQEPYRDLRSWVFIDCQSLNGKRGYTGMLPFSPPTVGDENGTE